MNKSLTLTAANVLLLLTMLLIITLGAIIQVWNLSIGLILTEALLILAPALLFLRARQIPFKEGLRLNPIRPLTAGLCVLLGFSTYLFSMLIEVAMIQLTGMNPVPLLDNSLPTGIFDSALYFIALAVAAPICEEALFRGVIQGAYEARRPAGFAILITAGMFAIYHFRLSGLPGLIPVALILGFVAWRTQSIYASMLIHFGMNATSAANTLVAILVNQTGLGIISMGWGLAGLVATGAILYTLHRLHPAPAAAAPAPSAEAAPEPAAPARSWLGNYWPLFGAGLLYLAVAGLTLVSALSSGLGVNATPRYFPPRVDKTIESTYRIANRAGDEVGEMSCQLTPQTDSIRLDCQRTVKAFELKQGNSFYADGGHAATWFAVWNARTLALQEYAYVYQGPNGSGTRAALADGKLTVSNPGLSDSLEVASSDLLEYEWAWRAAALQADSGDRFKARYGDLLAWDEKQKKSAPALQSEVLQVSAFAPLDLPAGRFDARQVSLAGQSAWFAVVDDNIPRLVQFDDGMYVYSLK